MGIAYIEFFPNHEKLVENGQTFIYVFQCALTSALPILTKLIITERCYVKISLPYLTQIGQEMFNLRVKIH